MELNKISDWWNKNMNDDKLNTFKDWVKDCDAETKKYSREYIIKKQYKSICDVGCGDCTMFDGFIKDNYDIAYTGIDSCNYFIEIAESRNINIINCDMNKIDIKDNSYDVVFARHVLEHQPTFKDALSEFIRIAKKEVIVVFFLKPENKEFIRYGRDDLYHNIYSKSDIEDQIKYKYEWVEFDSEIILHIWK